MKTRIKINDDGSLTPSPNQRAYLVKFVGKDFVGEPDERSNVEKIKFIEGAITPYFYYQHLKGVYQNFKEARNGLKWACNWTGFEIDEKGEQREVTKSMSDIYSSKTRTQWFIDMAEQYFRENGYRFPDSEHYRAWEKMAPDKGAVYPPLQELVDKYNSEV